MKSRQRITLAIPAGFGEVMGAKQADKRAAMDALLAVARYLRARKPVPAMLADHVADAIERAAPKGGANRENALLVGLGLRAGHKRREVDPRLLASRYRMLRTIGASKTAAIAKAAERFGVSTDTVKRAIKPKVQ